MGNQAALCRPIAVDGGGEGGEGGEVIEPQPAPIAPVVLTPEQRFRDRRIVTDFVDRLIVPNYQQLTQRSGDLSEAIATFRQTPTEATLADARRAWLATRQPWEQSEAFAFGPAASLGLDAELDDWPLNETDVLAVLNSDNALTPDYVATLQTSQKGFHAIAFLLFGTNADKPLSAFTERELDYLTAIGPVFDATANALLLSWTEGIDGYPAYREEFVKAGESSGAYLTVQDAGEEIVQGILGILDELGNVKMGEALASQNPFLLESRFAQHSLQDFADNLRSAQNAYLGQFPASNSQGRGLQTFVASVDPALDAEIQAQMQVAQGAIAAIPGPIEITLCDPSARPQIETAMASVLTLFNTFEQRVLPLVQQ
ncbi:imelysin family protein [Nodosilinea sp. E11]|uniref:imelysin family protein n=1 Tax=Nodosilinea sp. E11 TaxID=3037479 RepID=UPI002934A1FB|nr:imelysin family protein [Nodosilinea sp. E11]WOD39606.1 imelysin family protein [Nodosilinea sp. E11]